MRRILFAILLVMTTVITKAQAFDFKEVDCGPESTTFQLFAPGTAKRVVVRIYNDGIGGKPIKTVKMRRQESGVWSVASYRQGQSPGQVLYLRYG